MNTKHYKTYTYSKKCSDLTSAQVWKSWVDVANWDKWLDDIDHAILEGPMQANKFIDFRPKGGPNLKLEITECIENQTWTDVTRFPLAKMYDRHDVIATDDGVEIKSTLILSGPLAFLWNMLVVKGIAASLEKQTDALVNYVREQHKDSHGAKV